MTKRLTAITPSYSSFKDDQVLTAGQLNELLNYFDDQDRMSRIFLSGVGIVCGFKPEIKTNNSVTPPEKHIKITQGCGVTTDGDLLHLSVPSVEPDVAEDEENINIRYLTYTSFVSYSDEKAEYKPFFYNGGNQIELYELLTEEDSGVPGAQPLNAFTDLEDMIVLLYLESYPEEPTSCTGISCDDMGVKQVQKLRALLVSRDEAQHIISYDSIFNYQNILTTYVQLPTISVPRVILNQLNIQSYSELSEVYRKVITATGIIQALQKGFEVMLEKLEMNQLFSDISAVLNTSFNPSNTPVYVQYWYDLLKDVVDTYNEMKALFPEALCGCDPDITAFPKHLLLGPLRDLTESDLKYNNYRHSFLKSPVLSDFCSAQKRLESLGIRIVEMLNANQEYILPTKPIKITPSKTGTWLGNKAIPFYYNVNNELLKYWNYDKTERYEQKWNLSYHTELLANSPIVQDPLSYDLEKYDFLRIEGHQGELYTPVLHELKSLRTKFGLNFDVIDLGITLPSTETIDIEDYPCEFADLQAMLDAWREQNSCMLANASKYLSSYDVFIPWRNVTQVAYYEPQGKESIALSLLGNRKAATNIVYDQLDKKEGTVGKYIADAYNTYIGCSANDIINQAIADMAGISFKNYSPLAYDLSILTPVKALSYSLMFMDVIPVRLRDLNRSVFGEISLNANNICVIARQATGVIGKDVAPSLPPASVPGSYYNSDARYMPDDSAYTKEYPGSFNLDYSYDFEVMRAEEKAPVMITNIMEDLLKTCCNVKQIEKILDEIDRRKAKIILKKKLSEFIKDHPGLEHLGGVKPGGTFVVVRTSESVGEIPANTIIADFSLPYSCNCKCEI